MSLGSSVNLVRLDLGLLPSQILQNAILTALCLALYRGSVFAQALLIWLLSGAALCGLVVLFVAPGAEWGVWLVTTVVPPGLILLLLSPGVAEFLASQRGESLDED